MNNRERVETAIVVMLAGFAAVETYQNTIEQSSLFNYLFNAKPGIHAQDKRSELEQKIKIILENREFSPDFSKIVITCVDPKYPASSADSDRSNPVKYDSHHVQKSSSGDAQVSLKYDGNESFISIPHESVHDSLKQGVVQLDQHVTAQNLRTLVVAIPGDCYAFNPSGTGFSFDNPGYAKPKIAEQLLDALIKYSSSDNITFYAMAHPDCGLFANNKGKRDHELVTTAEYLMKDISSYPSSNYSRVERTEKIKGAEHLKSILSHYPNVKEVHAVLPPYQPRIPGIVNALHSSAH